MNDIFAKAKRKAWYKIVHALRKTELYNCIYPSYWHMRFNENTRRSDYPPQYLAARPHPTAGIGHQLANWLAGVWFSKLFDLKFAHIPVSLSIWERALGLANGEETVEHLVKQGYKIVRLPLFDEFNGIELNLIRSIIRSYSGKHVIFLTEQDQNYFDQFGAASTLATKFERARQSGAHHYPYDEADKALKISVHIRRGDVVLGAANGVANHAMRIQSIDYFVNIIETILKLMPSGHDFKISIFTQGSSPDFDRLRIDDNIELCSDMDPVESFLRMAYSDVLVTSKSSFSYSPALLNHGLKICPRGFWHGYPKSDDWILTTEDGNIDYPTLQFQLRKLVA